MCTRPLARCERIGDTFITKEGKLSHNCDFLSWAEIEENKEWYKKKYLKVQKIPCGRCMECRLQKSREWANRIILEKKSYPEEQCWFITLTYDDLHIPTHTTINEETGEMFEGLSLKVKDIQDFNKKLRRYYKYHYNVDGIRYFLAGEYGSKTHRPHYHIIYFGLPLDQTKLKLHTHNELGQSIWTHEEIEKIWGKGFVTIGRVTWESAAYVARYCTKKMYGQEAEWWYKAQGIIPEFTTCSREPAIGFKYLKENQETIYHTDNIPIANKKTLELVKPPKAFDRYMEKINPEFMADLKHERTRKAELAEEEYFRKTDLSPTEWRKQKEEKLKTKSKSLIREL